MGNIWKIVEQRWKQILLAVGAVVLLVTAVWLEMKHAENKRLEAQLEYFEILKIKDDAAKSLELERFVEDKAGKDAAYLAGMWLGAYYHKEGDLEKAAKYYDSVIEGTRGKVMQLIAIDALVPIYIGVGRLEEAAELYLKEAVLDGNPQPDLSRFKAAKVFELAKKFEKAEDIYEKLVNNENTSTELKLKVEEQMLWLEVAKR